MGLGIQVSGGRTRAPVGPGPRVGERVGGLGRWVEPNNNTKWGDTAKKACVDLALIPSPPAPNNSTAAQAPAFVSPSPAAAAADSLCSGL